MKKPIGTDACVQMYMYVFNTVIGAKITNSCGQNSQYITSYFTVTR